MVFRLRIATRNKGKNEREEIVEIRDCFGVILKDVLVSSLWSIRVLITSHVALLFLCSFKRIYKAHYDIFQRNGGKGIRCPAFELSVSDFIIR